MSDPRSGVDARSARCVVHCGANLRDLTHWNPYQPSEQARFGQHCMLSVTIVDSERELEQLRQRWNTLLQQSAADTIFLTWEWVCAWWTSYGTGKRLCVVRVVDAEGPVAILPLYRTTLRQFGIAYSGLYFIGDGSSDSDYLDAIVRKGMERDIARALADFLQKGPLESHVLLMNEVPGTSPFLAAIRDALRSRGWLWREGQVPCAYVDLGGSWDAFMKRLAPRMRTKLRSLSRELETNFAVRFDRCERSDDLPGRLEDLFRLHRLRWQGRNQAGVFETDHKRMFYLELSNALLERGWLRFYSLAVDGTYVAHQFCFEYNGTLFLLQEGFDPQWEKRGVGNVLRAYVFRDCIERGVSTYDFLGGVTPHKLSWGSAVKHSVRAAAAQASLRNRLFFGVPAAVERAKRAVKAVVPERVLAWRRSLTL